ncbi:15-methylpalmitoyl-4-hydroxy-2-pyrone synthase [Scopulibacillus darangshiensis]|uniref:15-methylpalmitoyl-4-hydroxy-2-pyrone synthase n=1 Tax=Scopulibacillus darangshiensis TaxID=442528 RepID=A0A4V2SLK7_9BACL|nr:3-oxoacyl-[acyl-carrier-protein] synthase III C-terminal domain-containing protein [Scopulibacillus darangshiensis]TCP23816.1 15-methylpalmitoyl-4-hydroxy-2-pyrone synthase [Scopulibacillus darangshiensis]
MAHILSIGTANPPHSLNQEQTRQFARDFFKDNFHDIDRLLTVFDNGQIDRRFFSAPLEWFQQERTLREKNDQYIKTSIDIGIKAIEKCLTSDDFLESSVSPSDVDGLIYISTTGMSTPSIEAKIMNRMPFHSHTKRIPVWGLGCAGGAAGLARAFEFCRAYPESSVLVLCVELCSLTFQYGDRSKSNLVGTSLFADGAACVLVAGAKSPLLKKYRRRACPKIVGTETTLMPDSEDVMGWDVKEGGLHVVFAKSIPNIVEQWFKPTVDHFLDRHGLTSQELDHFIAHPGGRKVLEAYQKALDLKKGMTDPSTNVLQHYGNMSSPTVLFVLEHVMARTDQAGERGVAVSLGPGFSSECLLLEWERIS